MASWCEIDFGTYGFGNPLPIAKHFYLNDSEIIDLVIPDGVRKFGTAFRGCKIFTSVKIPNSVNNIENGAFSGCQNLIRVEIGDGVQTIGDNAFYNCIKLPSVTIPGNVSTIGEGAFRDCQKLAKVNICNGVKTISSKAFEGCTNLPSIEFPNSVEVIQYGAFNDCEKLTKIVLGNGLKRVGRAFSETSLTEVHISDLASWCRIDFPDGSPLSIAKHLYMNGKELRDAVIPDGVTSLGAGFSNCLSLVSVTIPNSVKKIGDGAFSHCSNLESVKTGDGVTSIGMSAFGYCGNLRDVELGKNITIIDEEAFYRCSCISAIVIPDKVVSINKSAFSGCSGMLSVTFGKGLNSIKSNAFFNCNRLDEIHISDIGAWCGVSIEDDHLLDYARHLFLGDEEIIDLVIPNTITDFGRNFRNCLSIVSVQIPYSVLCINIRAFENCENLSKIEIGKKVNTIGDYAFYGCKKLSEVHIKDVASWCNIKFGETNAYANPLKIARHLFMDGKEINDLVIPNTVEGFGDAFQNCLSFKSVVIGNIVKIIEKEAFKSCDSLKMVDFVINSVLREIKDDAFRACSQLIKVTLPSTLQSLGSAVFYDSILLDIYANMEYPFEILENVFNSETYENAVLHVKSNKIAERYRETFAWSKFFHIVVGDTQPSDGDGGKDSGNYIKGGGGGGAITIRTYNYDITAKGKGDVVIDKIDESTGTEKGWTSAFDGLKMREEQRMVEIVHYPDSGVPFKFIPDAGYVVKQVQFSPDKDGTLKDVTDEIVYDDSFSGYYYKAFDKDTSVKLVVTFEVYNPDQPETILPVGDSFQVNTNNATCTYLVTNGKEVSLTNSSLTGKVNIPSTVSYGGVEYTVTAVGSDSGKVFETEGITEVVIPNTVKTIGANAFYNCTSMTSIQLPSSLKRINDAAFVGCSGLTVIDIPSNLDIIGMGCFTGCSSLRAFTVGTKTDGRIGKYYKVVDGVLFGTWSSGELSSLVAYPNKHGDTFVVPHGVTKILNYAFCLTEVKEVTLPVGLRIIYDYAFAYCSNLKKLTAKAIIPCKADNAFIETAPYATLHIPSEGLRELYQTESGWKEFGSITAGNSNITAFADNDRMMFYRVLDGSSVALIAINTEVKGVAEIPASVSHGGITYNVTYIGTNDEKEVIMGVDGVTRHFNYSVLEMYGEHPSVLTGVVIPNTVTTIGNDAFSKAKITSLDIPGSVKEIGDWAFYLNEGLASVTFKSGLEKIGEGAFAGCGITRVDLPEGVTSIGSQAFNIGWLNMEVTIPATVHFIGSYAFQSSPDLGTELKINITDLDAWSRIESDGEYWEAPVFWYRLYQNGEEVHEVTIPTGMTSISKVFLSLQGLTKVTIPESVTDYGTAFYWCENLKEVVNLSETPQAIRIFTSGISSTRTGTRSDEQEYVAFGKTDKNACVLYVPTGTSTLYQKAEGWKDFKNILEISNTGIGIVESDRKPFDVYDLQGRKVRSGIISVDDLPSGIYIIRGKKVIVK